MIQQVIALAVVGLAVVLLAWRIEWLWGELLEKWAPWL